MVRKMTYWLVIVLVVSFLGFIGCAQEEEAETGETAAEAMDVTEAVAQMQPTEGNEAHGTVTFTQTEERMRVVAHFENVPPGEHGFHIHEVGDCNAPDATSAGGHFNPTDMPHAGPDAEQRHIGDLGNITADSTGVAHAEFVDPMLTFEGANSILGKGVILHADPDDLTTQPTGNAGARISCGVIEASEEYSEKQ